MNITALYKQSHKRTAERTAVSAANTTIKIIKYVLFDFYRLGDHIGKYAAFLFIESIVGYAYNVKIPRQ